MPKKPPAPPLTEQQLRTKLEKAVEQQEGRTGISGLARQLGIDIACLWRFLNGKRPTPGLLKALGLETQTTVVYVPAKKA